MLAHERMLPPYIIEELRRREQARREESIRPQPRVELPLEPPRPTPATPPQPDRGIAIIDVW